MNKRILIWILRGFTVLAVTLIILLLLLRSNRVQNYVSTKILDQLSERYHAQWSIEDIDIDFFDEITLKGVQFLDTTGDTLVSARRLHVDIGLLSLFGKKIVIDDVEIDTLYSHIYQVDSSGLFNYNFLTESKNDSNSIETSSSSWDFQLNHVKLNHPHIRFASDAIDLNIQQQLLDLEIDQLDLENKIINLQSINLTNGSSLISIKDSEPSAPTGYLLPTLPYSISLKSLYLTDQNIVVIINNDRHQIDKLNTHITDIKFADHKLNANANNLTAKVKDWLDIDKLQGQVTVIDNTIIVNQLELISQSDEVTATHLEVDLNDNMALQADDLKASLHSTTVTRFDKYLNQYFRPQKSADFSIKTSKIEFSSQGLKFDKLDLSYGKNIQVIGNAQLAMDRNQTITSINANLNKLAVNLPILDAILVHLEIPDTYKNYQNLLISGKAEGDLKKLKCTDFSVLLDDALDMNFSGNLSNIDNTDQLSYNMNISRLKTNIDKLPIEQVEAIDLASLGNIAFDGLLTGNTKNIGLNGNIATDIGYAIANIELMNIDTIDQLKYNGDIVLDGFQLGTFLKRTDVGNISLNTKITGSGTNIEMLNANVKGQVQSLHFRDHEYNDITIDSDFKNNKLAGKISVNDESLKLDYDGVIKFDSVSTIANFQATIDTIALADLGLYDQKIGFKTKINANIKLPLTSGEKGKISLRDLSINNTKTSYTEDSIMVDIGKLKDSTSVVVTSGLLDASVSGEYKVNTMLDGLLSIVNEYYSINSDSVLNSISSNKYNINATIKHIKPLQVLMPDKDIQLGQGRVSLHIDDVSKVIHGNISLDSLIYDLNIIPTAKLNIGRENNAAFVNLTATKTVLSNGMNLPLIQLNNSIANSQLTSSLTAENENNELQLSLSSLLSKSDSIINVSILDTINIKTSKWAVSKTNSINIHDGNFTIHDLTFSERNTFISINSTDQIGNDFDIQLDKFDIGPILDFYLNTEHDSEIKLDGLVQVKNLRSNPFYLVDLIAKDVILNTRNIGNLTIKADQNPNTKLISAVFDLTGVKNDFNANGTFDPSDKRINFDLEIPKLQLKVLDPFLTEIISQSKGYVSGKAKISGTSDEPQINGDLTFEDVWTTIMVNNSRYNITQHTVTFDNKSIDLGNLELKDNNGDIARVKGKIYHEYLDHFTMDLNVDTDKFVFLNTTAENNPIFYGKMVLDANATIRGPIDLLDVDVVASSLDSTSITISPFSETESILKEDFISFGKPEDFETNTEEYLLKLARLYPFKVDIQLQAKENALFTFVVDPVTGDKIQTKGTGNLQIKLDPDGQQEIFGTYEISSGDYSFSYGDFVTKKFKIEEGGKIKFNGNPLTATLDIKAVYQVYTSTYELIKNEVSLNDSELSSAQNRTNVEVYLALAGSLESPEITLDIKIPTAESSTNIASIDRKLAEIRNNPNELSNQVFGLLLFNSFIISNSSNSSNSTVDNIGSSIALSSISSLISGQLNNLANNYVKGVDVSVDVNSYNSEYLNEGSGGNVTEIGLQVSKQLFNDRVKITAGGNVNLEESTGTSQYTSFVGDFVLEYKLTESGKYRVRVFSKSNYDRLLNENNNKNGVSLYFNKSFDRKINESKK